MKIESIVLRELSMSLIHPFATSFGETRERRVLLVEVRAEGLSGWGECTTGEHPYFSEESTDTAWVTILQELVPLLDGCRRAERWQVSRDLSPGARPPHGQGGARKCTVGSGSADAPDTLVRAIGGHPGDDCLRGLHRHPAFARKADGESGARRSPRAISESSLSASRAGMCRCSKRFAIAGRRFVLSCDANSAYRLRDADHLTTFDQFNLLMIEQPLWADDFYFHAMLQQRLDTAICLDESIRNRRDALAAIEMESCRIINIKLGRVGGFSEAIAIHNATLERGIPVWCGGMLESGIGRSHNIALSTLENFSLPGDVSASRRYWAEDIIEPEVTVSAAGEIRVPNTPGRGFEVRTDLIERLTVRKEEIKAMALVS